MKQALQIILGLLVLLFSGADGSCGVSDFTNAISYTPPIGYSVFPLTGWSDEFFSLDGAGIKYLNRETRDSLIFQVAIARAYIGQGNAIYFLSATPLDLKRELEGKYGKILTNLPTATVGEMAGLTDVRLTIINATQIKQPAKHNPQFYQADWIQLETNFVLKVYAIAHDADAFKAITNSLRLLKIDKAKILISIKTKS